MKDSVQSFSQMLRQALGERLRPDAHTFLDMFAEDGVMEFPFAPPGMTERLQGRVALNAHLQALAELIAFDRIGDPEFLATSDPQIVVLQFDGFGRGVETDELYEQRYISVIRVRDGQIVHYKDYWNPLAVLRATRGAPAVGSLVGVEMHDA